MAKSSVLLTAQPPHFFQIPPCNSMFSRQIRRFQGVSVLSPVDIAYPSLWFVIVSQSCNVFKRLPRPRFDFRLGCIRLRLCYISFAEDEWYWFLPNKHYYVSKVRLYGKNQKNCSTRPFKMVICHCFQYILLRTEFLFDLPVDLFFPLLVHLLELLLFFFGKFNTRSQGSCFSNEIIQRTR